MKRPDLDAGGKFDGWQVLDPTPQEMSGGTGSPVFSTFLHETSGDIQPLLSLCPLQASTAAVPPPSKPSVRERWG